LIRLLSRRPADKLIVGGAPLPAFHFWFSGPALAAFIVFLGGIVGVVSLGYGWYRAAVTEQDAEAKKGETAAQKVKTERTKQLLGFALTAGDKLLGDVKRNRELSEVEAEANAWVNKVHQLIVAAYGDGEAALFLDSSGYVFFGDGSEKSKLRNGIDGRMRRITELLRRSDTLSTRSDFDPSTF
jgi:type VI protein secretion system component VasK